MRYYEIKLNDEDHTVLLKQCGTEENVVKWVQSFFDEKLKDAKD